MMVDVATIRCMAMINELSRKIKNGVFSFDNCSEENKNNNCLFYCHKNEEHAKIVLDCLVGDEHHDIISTYDDYCGKYYGKAAAKVDLCMNSDGAKHWIEISFPQDNDIVIIDSDGTWYMS